MKIRKSIVLQLPSTRKRQNKIMYCVHYSGRQKVFFTNLKKPQRFDSGFSLIFMLRFSGKNRIASIHLVCIQLKIVKRFFHDSVYFVNCKYWTLLNLAVHTKIPSNNTIDDFRHKNFFLIILLKCQQMLHCLEPTLHPHTNENQ
jgi:hypothetical protein